MEIAVNKQRISHYFNLPGLNQAERERDYATQDSLYTATLPVVQSAYIFGIEVEVENIPTPHVNYKHLSYWQITIDHSLRNNGAEFVSIPLKARQIEAALDQLDKSLPEDADFSPRTSIHVHMNVRDLTIDQIMSLMLVYTATEELLFDWAGINRTNNVFCVRITDTNYVQSYLQFLQSPDHVVNGWHKYTAFNMHPMESKGTVEFRHMAGTRDVKRIHTWVNILACLKTFAKRYSPAHMVAMLHELNSTSAYESFLMDVFGDYATHLLPHKATLQEKMENSISYIKLATIAKQVQQEELDMPIPAPAPYRRTTIRPADWFMHPPAGMIMDDIDRTAERTRTLGEMMEEIRRDNAPRTARGNF